MLARAAPLACTWRMAARTGRRLSAAAAMSLIHDPVPLLLRLAVAALCGALLGLNRGRRQKPAGLRTHSLVAIGAAFAAWTAFQLEHRDPAAVTRIMSGAMTGVGFLGAGVILHDEVRGRIEGLTTAATIWMAAILGLGAGAGLYLDCLLTLGAVMLVLQVSARLQSRMAGLLLPRLPGRRPAGADAPGARPPGAGPEPPGG